MGLESVGKSDKLDFTFILLDEDVMKGQQKNNGEKGKARNGEWREEVEMKREWVERAAMRRAELKPGNTTTNPSTLLRMLTWESKRSTALRSAPACYALRNFSE